MKKMILSLCLSLVFLPAMALADYSEGVAAYQAKDYNLAIQHFNEAIEQLKIVGGEDDPQYAPYYFMLGQSLYRSGSIDKSIEPLKKALKLNSTDVGVQLVLGQAYFKLKDYKAAASTLGSIKLESLPASTQGAVSNMLSVSYEKSGQEGLALSNMEKAAKLNPNDAVAQFNYGTRALGADYTTEAVAALAKAVSLEGSNVQYRRAYGNALIRQGRETQGSAKIGVYTKAVENGNQLVKLEGSYENYLHLAEADLGAKKYSEAVGALDQAIGKKSSEWLPYYYKSQALTSLGKYNDAIKPLETALAKPQADQRKINSQLGFVYEKLKQYPASITAYKKAGDTGGLARVEENQRIAQENQGIEAHNAEIDELEAERKRLEEELKALPGAGAPPR